MPDSPEPPGQLSIAAKDLIIHERATLTLDATHTELPAQGCLFSHVCMHTRSRKLVVLVGTLKALAIAVRNMDAHRRVTLLKQRRQAIDGDSTLVR